MVQNYSYEHLPPPPEPYQPYQPAPFHHSSNGLANPRTLQPLGTINSQPYHPSSYAFPPPTPDMPVDYRQPASPNYTHAQNLPLPPISSPIEHGYGPAPVMDTTGQIAPPGMRPRLTTSIFEEEGSLCFQVDVNGICVARREDNHMINGTKLLNVAQMTRGRRDGILKAEKQKNVVKIGPMHLKGVWIPYERALALANQERITEHLYPLFVHNISSLLYHPINAARPVPLPPTYNRGEELNQPRLNSNGQNPPPVANGEDDDDRRPRL